MSVPLLSTCSDYLCWTRSYTKDLQEEIFPFLGGTYCMFPLLCAKPDWSQPPYWDLNGILALPQIPAKAILSDMGIQFSWDGKIKYT